ncbi:MAG TPA: ECF transporter S component [Candidatus Lustribacter sp.]|nr:ECF transporter S component [Candidatus Lustribacter sp.]
MATHHTTGRAARARTPILASRPLAAYRTIDLITLAFLGVAFGLAFWAWGKAYAAPAAGLAAVFPPLQGVTSAPWLMAGVVGGLVVRRPGAALFTELIAAVVSMLPGTQWGAEVFVSGLVQGLGAEIGFALLAYARYGPVAAALAGACAAPLEAVYEWYAYWTDWGWSYKVAYLLILTVAGAAVAGLGGWALTRALARSGALAALPPGLEARAERAV